MRSALRFCSFSASSFTALAAVSTVLAVLPVFTLAEGRAEAADAGPSLDLRGFHAPTDAASGVYMEPAATPDTLDWNVGLWLLYAHRPITLRDPETNDIRFDVLRHQLTGDLTASVGFKRRFALGIDLPFALYQGGDAPIEASTRVLGSAAIPRQALGDLGVTGKLTLVRPTGRELGGFGLALHERITVPTGDEASYLGEGHISSETRLLAEYRLLALGVHVAAGVKIRGEEERFACAATPAPSLEDEVDPCPTRFGHELPFGLGLSLRPQAFGIDDAGRWVWFIEGHGHIPLAPVAPFSDGSSRVAALQVDAGARVALGDVSVLAGIGTTVLGSIGGAPVRALVSVGWAPRVHDADGDGVEDDKDQCRELPEDRDGFEDRDGCPEGDNDDDGVPDADDRCPSEREDEDGFEDDDGCIDPDNDGDKILDAADACPDEAGVPNADPAKNGCPVRDGDNDGIEGDKDKCPEVAEDKDGFEDDDGCPDPDNDDDDIPDAEDACPDVAGVDSPNAKERGCPDPDRDRDTLLDAEDKCPGEAETWNGIDDADGCADDDPKKKAKPLVAIKEAKAGPELQIAGPLKLAADKPEVDAGSVATLRAIGSELLKRPGWKVIVGVRPKPKGGEDEAKASAKVIADALRRFTRSEASAEVAPWASVKDAPGAAAAGIGIKILGAKSVAAAAGQSGLPDTKDTNKKR